MLLFNELPLFLLYTIFPKKQTLPPKFQLYGTTKTPPFKGGSLFNNLVVQFSSNS